MQIGFISAFLDGLFAWTAAGHFATEKSNRIVGPPRISQVVSVLGLGGRRVGHGAIRGQRRAGATP
jgi:hypothetical protein